MDDNPTGLSLAERARLAAKAARDDHADGARCNECPDEGQCPRLASWRATIARMGDALDEPLS